MLARGVRKSISDSIIARVFGGPANAGTNTPAREGASTPATASVAAPRNNGAVSTPTGDVVDIVYVCRLDAPGSSTEIDFNRLQVRRISRMNSEPWPLISLYVLGAEQF